MKSPVVPSFVFLVALLVSNAAHAGPTCNLYLPDIYRVLGGLYEEQTATFRCQFGNVVFLRVAQVDYVTTPVPDPDLVLVQVPVKECHSGDM